MLLTEYDEVAHMRHVREEGREEGREEQRKKDEEEFEEELAKRTLEMIISVMQSLSVSPEEAMAIIKIPDADRDRYLEALSALK